MICPMTAPEAVIISMFAFYDNWRATFVYCGQTVLIRLLGRVSSLKLLELSYR